MIAIAIGWGVGAIFFPSVDMIMLYICYIIFGGAGVVVLAGKLNMNTEETKISNQSVSKRQALRIFREKYYDGGCFFGRYSDIPEELHDISHYLVYIPERMSKEIVEIVEKKSPDDVVHNKIVELIEQEIADDVIRAKVCFLSPEPKWWKYFFSWKWLKKVK